MAKQATHLLKRYYSLNLDLDTDANNFAPNEFREVVNLCGLAVYKGSNTKGEIILVQLKGNKSSKVNGVNYGGNMDRGPMIFTSDVSLPKDDNNNAG